MYKRQHMGCVESKGLVAAFTDGNVEYQMMCRACDRVTPTMIVGPLKKFAETFSSSRFFISKKPGGSS